MDSRDLLRVARDLVATSPASQAHFKRAVGSAYYALFHEICKLCADELITPQASIPKMSRAWRHTYRALNHGDARKACKKIEDDPKQYNFPSEIRELGINFSTLQKKRHEADYDPTSNFSDKTATELINRAEKAIDQLTNVAAIHKKTFATFVLLPQRM